jgi:uridine kinase
MINSIIIGAAGGSGSGKTTFCKRLLEHFGTEKVSILGQDSYYIDQSSKFDCDGGAVNFDHPSSLDFDLLSQHLKQIKSGEDINVPVYDFATHKRLEKENPLSPSRVIIVDGILILSQPNVFKHFDYSVFIDCPEDLRFSRRLNRDVKERGRQPEGVRDQFYKQVKPMHDLFVEPSKSNADDVVGVENFDKKCDEWVRIIGNHL